MNSFCLSAKNLNESPALFCRNSSSNLTFLFHPDLSLDVHVPAHPGLITSQAHYHSSNPSSAANSWNLPESTQMNPFLRGLSENCPFPVYSVTTNLPQQNAPERVQTSQASIRSYASWQISQEEKPPLEMENLQTEVLQVHLPSIVKPLEDPVTNNEESRNTVVPENEDQPDRGSQNVSPGKQQGDLTAGAGFGENLPFSWPQEKAPVDRCIFTDFYDAGLHWSQKKCPLEMSYDTIKSYRGAEELGRGGFGVVYEGTKSKI